MDILTDESLIKKVQDGQVDACGLLYTRYKKLLYGYFYNTTSNGARSEDLVQLTFEKVLKYKKNFTGQGSFRSWLFTIARNTYIDDYHRKKKNRTVEMKGFDFAHEEHGEQRMIEKEQSHLLHRALQTLDDEKRELLCMIKLNDMKYQQVADIYGLSLSNVKTKVFRIMKELKANAAKMKEYGQA